jgi:hypothetical protein
MTWILAIGAIWFVAACTILLWNHMAHRNDDPDDDWFQ